MGVRIIHRSTDFYIVAKIESWDAYYIQGRIIFEVLRYLTYHFLTNFGK